MFGGFAVWLGGSQLRVFADPPLFLCVHPVLQVAPYELLRSLKSQAVEPAIMEVGGVKVTVEMQ